MSTAFRDDQVVTRLQRRDDVRRRTRASDALPTASHGSLGTLTAPVAATEIPVGPLVPWLAVDEPRARRRSTPPGRWSSTTSDRPARPCRQRSRLRRGRRRWRGRGGRRRASGRAWGAGPPPPPRKTAPPRSDGEQRGADRHELERGGHGGEPPGSEAPRGPLGLALDAIDDRRRRRGRASGRRRRRTSARGRARCHARRVMRVDLQPRSRGRRPPGRRAWRGGRGGVETGPCRAGSPSVSAISAGSYSGEVAQHEDRALLRRQATEAAIELVPVGHADVARPSGSGGRPAGPAGSRCVRRSRLASVMQDRTRRRRSHASNRSGSRSAGRSRQAITSASCTASSARSMSRRIRCAIANSRSRGRGSGRRTPPDPRACRLNEIAIHLHRPSSTLSGAPVRPYWGPMPCPSSILVDLPLESRRGGSTHRGPNPGRSTYAERSRRPSEPIRLAQRRCPQATR